MLNNKADAIEEYILKMLSENQGGQVELKRTDLADEVSCAPSQVSYVLSTRFTHSRGFKVESRRGLGGYIRITILEDVETEKKKLFDEMIRMVERDIPLESVKILLDILLQKQFISERECKMFEQMIFLAYILERDKQLTTEGRILFVRTLFTTLLQLS